MTKRDILNRKMGICGLIVGIVCLVWVTLFKGNILLIFVAICGFGMYWDCQHKANSKEALDEVKRIKKEAVEDFKIKHDIHIEDEA